MELIDSEEVISWWWVIVSEDFEKWIKGKEKKILENKNYDHRLMTNRCIFFALSREFFWNSMYMLGDHKKTWECYENKIDYNTKDIWVDWLWRLKIKNPDFNELWYIDSEIKKLNNNNHNTNFIKEIEIIRIWKQDIKEGNDLVFPKWDPRFMEKFLISEAKMASIMSNEKHKRKNILAVLKMKKWLRIK